MALSTSSRKVSVEQLWNCYALEDEDQRKKLWLDLFLCRAIKEDVDPFMCGHVSRTRIVPHLIAELKNEIGLFCRPSLAANDLEQLKRYVYEGRGWKLLLVLNTILSNAAVDLPFLREEDGKEFVDLLISLYQLSVFPHSSSSNAKSRGTGDNSDDQTESISAMDLWHETLMTVASVEHGKQHETNLEVLLVENDQGLFSPVLELWQHLYTVTRRKEKGPFPNVMTKRQKKRAEKTLLRGFVVGKPFAPSSSSSSSSKSNFQVSNLFSYERRFSNCSKISSDSDSAEVEDLLQRNQYVYLPPPLSNPLDYEFFVNVIRSEDEAAQSSEWHSMKSKLTASPVTPSVRLQDIHDFNQHEHQERLSKEESMFKFAKLSSYQLSHLVSKLMTTICIVEIRWKLRQKKSQLPMTSNSLLYTMSYPLVQFASDTLTSTKNLPSNISLRLNLAALLLTGLSDVVLFGDLQLCFSELFQHHKILHKCLEVVKDAFKLKNGVKISILLALWRTFRVILEKHANPKTMKTTRELYRLKKEELVKSSCSWFSNAESGLASVTLTFLARFKLSTDECEATGELFKEIGRIVKAVGLCHRTTTPGSESSSNANPDTSYGYLKETRVSLSLIFNEATKVFIYFSQQQCKMKQHNVIMGAIAKCLFNSICVNTYVACHCALISPPGIRDDMLQWLESVWSHRYGKHQHSSKQLTTNVQFQVLPDSDSAFCASDSSLSVLESDKADKLKTPPVDNAAGMDSWQLYKDAFILPNCDDEIERLQMHLNKVMQILDQFGKQDMLTKLILPLLEHSIPQFRNEKLTLLYSMNSLQRLLPYCHSMDANLYKKKFSNIYPKLVSLCLTEFDSDIGFSAMQSLKMMAVMELSLRRPGYAGSRGSIEDAVPTSDEDGSFDSEDVFVNEMLSGALVIGKLQNHFSAKDVVKPTDLPLLLIQRHLIEANEAYGRHLIRSNFHRVLYDLTIDDIKKDREILVVVLQILSLLISLNDEEKLVKCRNQLFDHIISHGIAVAEANKIFILDDIISVFLASDCTDNMSCSLELPLPSSSQTNYDADVESDEKKRDNDKLCLTSRKLISNAGLTRSISLIDELTKKVKKDYECHSLVSSLWRIGEFIQKFQPSLSNMNLAPRIMNTIKNKEENLSLVQAALSVCEVAFVQGEPIDKVFLSQFLQVVQSTTQLDILERLMLSLNMLVNCGWKASTSPMGWITFPCCNEGDEELMKAAEVSPWIEWEISPKEQKIPNDLFFEGLTMSLWLSTSTSTVSNRPVHVASLGTDAIRIQILLLNTKQICIVIVNIGSATYDINMRKEEWFNLMVNVKVNDVNMIELSVKANLQPCALKKVEGSMKLSRCTDNADTSITLQIGSNGNHSSKYRYSHCWVFRKSLTAKEAFLMYCLGPTVTILEPMTTVQGISFPIIRKPLLKKAVLANSHFDSNGQSLLPNINDQNMLEELLCQCRVALCLVHESRNSQILHCFPSNYVSNSKSSSRLFQSFFPKTQSVGVPVPAPEPITATKVNCNIMVEDNYANSWCQALDQSGGISLLLLMLFHVTENKAGDTCIALVVDSLITTMEDGCSVLLMQNDAADVLSIVKNVLQACQDQVGMSTLQVFLKHSITFLHPDFKNFEESKNSHDFKGVIFSGQYLSFILENWTLWSTCQQEIINSFLMLVQDNHPARDVNVHCLRQLNLVRTLAYVLIKMPNNEENMSWLTSITELFSALVGSPPDLPVLNQLVQAALLLHESTYTYIHHAQNTFYFALQQLRPKHLTWPRTNTNRSLPKSASFCHQENGLTSLEGVKQSLESVEDQKAANDAHDSSSAKFNPERLQKVLRRTKRGGPSTSSTKRCVSMASPEMSHPEIHFGCLSRLEDLGYSQENNKSVEDFEKDEYLGDDDDIPMEGRKRTPHTLIEGILDILNGALINMPDSAATKATTSIIQPEFILVFLNHPEPHTRLSALKLLVKHVQRTERIGQLSKLLKIKGFHLLACQLTSWGCKTVPSLVMDHTASAILSLVHANDIFSTSAIPDLPTRGAKIRMYALPALLALLPPLAASGNVHLAITHSLIVHLHDITTRVQNFVKEGQEKFGLFEVLCRTLENLVISPKAFWTSDLGQDGRDILYEDLDHLFRFIGMHLATAAGSSSFNTLLDLTNLMISMICTYDKEEHQEIVATFRRYLFSIFNEGISDILQRLRRLDFNTASGGGATFKNSLKYSGLILSNAEAGAANGEEVTELLMKSIVDNDKRMQESRPMRRRRATSYSSDDSFSFRADALRSHSNHPSEAIKPASRSELLNRLDQLVNQVTENCIYALAMPGNGKKPKEFLVSFMTFLMAQCQADHQRYLSAESCQSKLIRLAIACLHPNMNLEDKVDLQMQLSSAHDNWSRVFHSVVVQNSSTFQVSLYKKLVAKLAHECQQHFKNVQEHQESEKESLKSSSSMVLENIQQFSSLSIDGGDDDVIIRECEEELKNVTKSIADKVEKKTFQLGRDHAGVIADVTAKAIEATGVAMAAQDVLRKDNLMLMTNQLAQEVRTRHIIAQIVANLTHEKGPWRPTSKGHLKSSWKLDEIEGHQRMRLRLSRSYRTLDEKFYLAQADDDYEVPTKLFNHIMRPLQSSGKGFPGWAEVLIEQFDGVPKNLKSSSIVKVMETCWLVIPVGEVPGEILLTHQSIHFVQQGHIDPLPLYSEEEELPLTFSVDLDQIQEVWPRRYQLNDCALELFFGVGVTRLVAFADQNKRDGFLAQLWQMNPGWNVSSKMQSELTQQWQDGKLTNFDYLMALNKFAGRSFNDLMQYPIFPFVLSDYSSTTLDLSCLKSFRDLRRPISVQQKDKEEIYQKKYRGLAEELKVSHEITCPGVGPYHYGSHYSNAGIVLHFLVRLSPFTAMFLKYQDGNFDIPDRTFHDLNATWLLATTDTTTDVKELIPELFCTPEVLENRDALDLGEKQNGDQVKDVILPPWANNDPRLFIKIHRQALEADYVRENLPHWVDLIFGYKQVGMPAVDAINLFHPSTYYGFDLNSIKDPIQRQARATMIKTYGQTPKQLFSRPHPMPHIRLTTSEKVEEKDSTAANVMGLKWGHIVGISSPSTQVFGDFATRVSLMPLSRDRMLGSPFGAISLFHHSKASQYSKLKTYDGDRGLLPSGACLVSLDSDTGWLVGYLKKGQRPQYLLPLRSSPQSDPVSCMHSIPDEKVFWIGYESGKMSAISYSLNTTLLKLSLEKIQPLYAHQDRVNDIAASRQWSLVASASADGSTVLWDTRKMSYVRSIGSKGQKTKSHQLVKISSTSGDIAIVTSASDLCLYSVNARFIGAQKKVEPAITSLAFSHESEGTAVNVIATGHCQTGVIRLWSTWDLSPQRDLATNHSLSPITSLAFSLDSKYLYASFADHFLAIFERFSSSSSSPVRSRPPNYLDLSRIITDPET